MSRIHVGLDWKMRRLTYCKLDEADTSWSEVKLPDTGKRKVKDENCGYQLGNWLVEQSQSWSMALIEYPVFWLEMPFAGFLPGGKRNVNGAIRSGLTVGGILALAPGDIHLVDQSTWKKELLGNGAAKKPDIAAWLEAHDSWLYEGCNGDEDRIDATCIALYGQLVGEG